MPHLAGLPSLSGQAMGCVTVVLSQRAVAPLLPSGYLTWKLLGTRNQLVCLVVRGIQSGGPVGGAQRGRVGVTGTWEEAGTAQ